MILIAYDGSDDAKAAIEHAGSLLAGQPAVVGTVWEPYVQMLTRYPTPGLMLGGDDTGEIDEASREVAEDKAEEGAALARSHGLGSLLLGSVSHALIQHADRTVVIVPSPKVARRRNEKRRPLDESAVN